MTILNIVMIGLLTTSLYYTGAASKEQTCGFAGPKRQKQPFAVRIQLLPNPVILGLTRTATLRCSGAPDSGEVRSIEITRHGSAVAIIKGDLDALVLDSTNNLKVSGNVTKDDPGQSYIELTWQLPCKTQLQNVASSSTASSSASEPDELEEEGEDDESDMSDEEDLFKNLMCVIKALDGDGKEVTATKLKSFVVSQPNVMDVVTHMQQLEIEITENTEKHAEKDTEKDSRIHDLELLIDQMNTTNAAMRDDTNSQMGRHQQEMQTLEDKLTVCSVKVAFQAYAESLSIHSGTTVVYVSTHLNEGNAYDNTTGLFTCRLGGIYVFNVQAVSLNSNGNEVVLAMKLNNDIVSALAAGVQSNMFDAASMSAVLHLKVGDVVKVETIKTSYLYGVYSNKINVFNGHIVQPDGC